jgi:hypothetical protein
MTDLKQIIQSELEKLKQELIDKHNALGMKASGKWIDSLLVEVTDSEGIIWGEDYTKQLIEGRPAGKFPPIKAIEKWIYDKGITSDIPIKSLAFLIARKIAQQGTNYYIQGGTDLVSGVVTDTRLKEIEDLIADIWQTEVIENLMTY